MTPLATEMMVSSGDERRTSRRAECRGVIHVVAKPVIGEPLEGGGLNRPAKGAAGAEPYVIRQDQQNVGCRGGSLDALGKVGRRILDCTAHLTLKRRFGLGQDLLRLLRLH